MGSLYVYPKCITLVLECIYIVFIIGLYRIILQPAVDEHNLPENATYDPNDLMLFPSSLIDLALGSICEKGKNVAIKIQNILFIIENSVK